MLKKIEENRQKALAKKRKRLEMEQMQNEIQEQVEEVATKIAGEKKFGDKGNEEVKLDTSFDKLSLEDEDLIEGLEDYLNDD